jgi:hypothetical protein
MSNFVTFGQLFEKNEIAKSNFFVPNNYNVTSNQLFWKKKKKKNQIQLFLCQHNHSDT